MIKTKDRGLEEPENGWREERVESASMNLGLKSAVHATEDATEVPKAWQVFVDLKKKIVNYYEKKK